MDRHALITALFGVGIGAVGWHFRLRREWWRVTAWLALGTAALLNLINEGTDAPRENLVKDATTATLMVIFAMAVTIHQRRARSLPDRPASQQ